MRRKFPDSHVKERDSHERLRVCSCKESEFQLQQSPGPKDSFEQAKPFHGEPSNDFAKSILKIKPTAIIGVSTVGGAFNQQVIENMCAVNERPLIFPYSNPTSRSECTAEQAYTWSKGKAIFASGSPFAPVNFGGRTFIPGQGNNVYIFPAVGLAIFATEAKRVTDEMFLTAAESVAEQVTEEDFEDRNERKMIMMNWEEKYSLYTKSYSITIAC